MANAFPSQLVKRQSSFGSCPAFLDIPKITNVTLIPDPPKANSPLEVKGSANTNDDIVDGMFFVFKIFNGNEKIYSNAIGICDVVTDCPTKVFDFDERYDLKDLPSSYSITVAIGANSSILACGFAQVN
ncbi:73_t:CDS:1 [Racocetra fulgida]|uniref:73_t:CDS:1 n=1 Tax=Racocetra fulgida TaxID=60492 RepID=A0A9N9APZ7_9GLOM|nr:73_t:CDS:1 [Racocetra fulgida]